MENLLEVVGGFIAFIAAFVVIVVGSYLAVWVGIHLVGSLIRILPLW